MAWDLVGGKNWNDILMLCWCEKNSRTYGLKDIKFNFETK